MVGPRGVYTTLAAEVVTLLLLLWGIKVLLTIPHHTSISGSFVGH